ncbi:MAG: argininosuccinate lyase [Treponema sp.]|nr:argininosuccinate lyase [Treponema sp.]
MAKVTTTEHGTITDDNHAALWHGRFKEGPDAAAVDFETSIYVDERMAFDDIEGSKAHATMLGKQGIIPQSDADAIVAGLDDIKKDLESGALTIDYSAEDIHSFIEATLTDRIGEAGKKVHTGRSRNDQVALDERLYLRHAVSDIQKKIKTLISCLTDIAEQHTKTYMPGFTHMQHAQPVTLAQHVCAWAWMLVRDCDRFSDAVKRLNVSPLGAGALAGSSLPLDREYVAQQLHFDGVTQNSLDSVSDRDYCIELASALAITQSHLSRFCEEVVLWATVEFGFIDLSEKWSTGSSIMPQKKNPDFAELIRGRTGRVYGDLMALLTMMKGIPLAYDRDMQEDKQSLFDAYDIVFANITVFTSMIQTATWNTKRMETGCEGGYLNATDIAEYLVRKGMPFRTAHGVSAKAVRKAIEQDIPLEKLTIAEFKECSPLIDDDIYASITTQACVEARSVTGGPAPEKVVEQITALRQFCK